MKTVLWMTGVVGIATIVYGQLEVGVEQVVGVSGAVTNGMVYQLQINDDLNDTNGWEDLYEPVISDAAETNHWYYHPNAYNGLIAQGADTNIVQLEDYILFIPGMGSIHSGSFPVAMVKGYLWLDSIAYTNR
jgi:hypothetical protein